MRGLDLRRVSGLELGLKSSEKLGAFLPDLEILASRLRGGCGRTNFEG